ncbi:unnamed protein product [Ceratitis capitata]|uniref:(Mediterranean fruit fly) hypothetical protein n=1 Tax=Ceratitis capitata TaxID=7213 RepID=A0A811U5S4_CERCA|nr:unnamed protein product [Ceratitis capitata]
MKLGVGQQQEVSLEVMSTMLQELHSRRRDKSRRQVAKHQCKKLKNRMMKQQQHPLLCTTRRSTRRLRHFQEV